MLSEFEVTEKEKNVKEEVVNVTQRDLDILLDLYTYRTLTTDQINKRYFDNRKNKDYLYRRMYLLRKRNLITSYPLLYENGLKKTSCYRLTDKGIRTLIDYGLLDENEVKKIRSWHFNIPNPLQLQFIVDANTVMVELSESGWNMLDSRTVKEEHQMDKNNRVLGMLINQDGHEHALYIFQNNPTDITITRIVNEIQKEKYQNVICLCKGQDGFIKLIREIEQKNKHHSLVTGELSVMPFNLGIEFYKKFNAESQFVKLFTNFGEVKPNSTRLKFTKYCINYQGEDMYLVNMLNNNVVILDILERYSYEHYQLNGIKCVLFAWDSQIQQLKERFG